MPKTHEFILFFYLFNREEVIVLNKIIKNLVCKIFYIIINNNRK